ncbi:MAG: hypothetical protein ACXWUG_18320 [Polyangiales bacterium]
MNDDEKRDLLERSANRTRARLIDTIDALDHRRHELMDVRGQIEKQVRAHWKPVAILGGLAVCGLGAALGFSIYWAATRRVRLRRERWKALRRFWFHPEQLARREPAKGTMAWSIGRKVLTATLTYVALEATKRMVRAALPPARTEELRHDDVVVRTLPA